MFKLLLFQKFKLLLFHKNRVLFKLHEFNYKCSAKEKGVKPPIINKRKGKTWKQPKCPLIDEWIKKMWHKNIMEYLLLSH